jgi:competence protein ComEC
VTFSSIILNFAALPLVGIIMAIGYIFLFFSFFLPILTYALTKTLHFLLDVFLKATSLLDQIQWISYRIPVPPLSIILGYFTFLFLLLAPVKIKKQRLIITSTFLIFFTLLITYPFPSHSKDLRITFIDVGQGESILVEFPGKEKMLIDGGGFPGSSFDIGEKIVSPFLWKKGIKNIHYLVLTHGHPDHLNGLVSISKNFKVGELWEAFSPQNNETYLELKKALSAKIPQKKVFYGYRSQPGGAIVEVVHPRINGQLTESTQNDNSLVLRITYKQTSFLLTADIGKEAEHEILETGKNIKSQVLKSPHHGSDSSSSLEFLERVSPQIAVISVGEGNRYGHPDNAVLKRYKNMGIKILRTDIQGAVEISSDGEHLSLRTARVE